MSYKNISRVISLILIILIILTSMVNAFGVTLPSRPESGKKPTLDLQAGEGQVLMYMLQNEVGNNPITIQVSLLKGEEISQILAPSEITIPPKTKDVQVPLKVTVPKNAKVGDQWEITIYFREKISGGGTSLGTGNEQGFYVKVYKLPWRDRVNRIIPFETKDIIGYLFIIVLLVVVIIFVRKNLFKKITK